MAERISEPVVLLTRNDVRLVLPLLAAGKRVFDEGGRLSAEQLALATFLATFAISDGNAQPETGGSLSGAGHCALVNVGEASRRLGFEESGRRVRQLLADGGLEGVKKGNRWQGVTEESLARLERRRS